MQCIKTGCSAFLVQYGEWVYGDAYETPSGDLVIRVAGRDRAGPLNASNRHFTVLDVSHWFDDRERNMQQHNSTLIAARGMFTNHGYEGVREH